MIPVKRRHPRTSTSMERSTLLICCFYSITGPVQDPATSTPVESSTSPTCCCFSLAGADRRKLLFMAARELSPGPLFRSVGWSISSLLH